MVDGWANKMSDLNTGDGCPVTIVAQDRPKPKCATQRQERGESSVYAGPKKTGKVQNPGNQSVKANKSSKGAGGESNLISSSRKSRSWQKTRLESYS